MRRSVHKSRVTEPKGLGEWWVWWPPYRKCRLCGELVPPCPDCGEPWDGPCPVCLAPTESMAAVIRG